MIETHAHIYDSAFDIDRSDMLERAFRGGIEQIWMPNCSSETIEAMLLIEAEYSEKCLSMMGLHPCYVGENFEKELSILEEWLSKRPFFMIGEIGIDYYWDLTYKQEQEQAFIFQLELAKKHNLPICIHSRSSADKQHDAFKRTCELIEDFDWTDLKGIFHCFSGDLNDAKRAIDLNFMLGIGGVATFKNGGLDNILPKIGLGNLVLETDSPYLAPVPHRGKRNEVIYLELVAKRIAELLGESIETVEQTTTQNAKKLLWAKRM